MSGDASGQVHVLQQPIAIGEDTFVLTFKTCKEGEVSWLPLRTDAREFDSQTCLRVYVTDLGGIRNTYAKSSTLALVAVQGEQQMVIAESDETLGQAVETNKIDSSSNTMTFNIGLKMKVRMNPGGRIPEDAESAETAGRRPRLPLRSLSLQDCPIFVKVSSQLIELPGVRVVSQRGFRKRLSKPALERLSPTESFRL